MIAVAQGHNCWSLAIEITLKTNGQGSLLHARAYTHMILRDGRFFTLFKYEIPHITYCKFNTTISNELLLNVTVI